jgi:hypothetical protein
MVDVGAPRVDIVGAANHGTRQVFHTPPLSSMDGAHASQTRRFSVILERSAVGKEDTCR